MSRPILLTLLVGVAAVIGCGDGKNGSGPTGVAPGTDPQPFIFHPGLGGGNRVYLSDMPELNTRIGWGKFGKNGMLGYGDRNGRELPIKVAGKTYAKGLSTHPGSNNHASVKYNLNRTAKMLQGGVALSEFPDGIQKAGTAVIFQIIGDHRTLWQSQPVQLVGVPQECVADVAGVERLELRVDCPGENFATRAVWLDPCVIY